MATRSLEETFDIPLSALDGKVPRGFGMDIGGTLTKVAHATLEGDFVRFHFNTYPKYEIHKAIGDLRQKLSGSIKPGDRVYTTGFGCNEFQDVINEGLDVTIINRMEMDCNTEAFSLFIKHLPLSQYVYPRSEKFQPYIDSTIKCFVKMEEMMKQQDSIKMKPRCLKTVQSNPDLNRTLVADDVFPILICTLGSGAFFCTMEADGQTEMIDINTSCGRMLMGLGSLLTGVKSFDELVELAETGDDSCVETKCKHVKNNDRPDVYALIPDETPIYCFGLADGKQISDFRREDLAAAVVSQLTQSMAQSCNLASMCADVKMVFFCGSLCSRSELIRDQITKHFAVKTAVNIKENVRDFYFLKHGGHVGALGALLLNRDLTPS